jgi:YegS/Rv2252/BmrU family lipid kinase
MKNILLIINPVSGNKDYKKYLPSIKEIFHDFNFKINIKKSLYHGDISDIVKKSDVSKYFSIVVMGGDGSFHEAINGMMNRKDKKIIPIGIIPNGSGNSLCRDLNLLNPLKAAKAIANNQKIKIDIAKIITDNTIIYNFNIIGWGLVSSIGIKAEKYRWLGPSRYTILSLIEIFLKKTFKSKITFYNEKGLKNEISDSFIFGVLCNTIHTGKGMKMAPKAKIDDGLLDLLLIKNVSRLKLLKLMPQLFSGTHINDENVSYFKTKKLKLRSRNNYKLNIDGEIKGSTSFDFEVLPKKITTFK